MFEYHLIEARIEWYRILHDIFAHEYILFFYFNEGNNLIRTQNMNLSAEKNHENSKVKLNVTSEHFSDSSI